MSSVQPTLPRHCSHGSWVAPQMERSPPGRSPFPWLESETCPHPSFLSSLSPWSLPGLTARLLLPCCLHSEGQLCPGLLEPHSGRPGSSCPQDIAGQETQRTTSLEAQMVFEGPGVGRDSPASPASAHLHHAGLQGKLGAVASLSSQHRVTGRGTVTLEEASSPTSVLMLTTLVPLESVPRGSQAPGWE